MRRIVAALALVLALPLAAQEPGAAYKLDQVAVRLDGGAGGSGFSTPAGCVATSVPFFGSDLKLGCDAELVYNGTTNVLSLGSIKASALTAGRVPIVGTGGLVGDDAGLLYDAPTDTLRVAGGFTPAAAVATSYIGVSANGYGGGGAFSFYVGQDGLLRLPSFGEMRFSTTVDAYAGTPDSGFRRVSAGLVGVTSGGSNLGSLQAGNVTATALGTPAVTSPLTVNGTSGVTTYGYKAVAFLNDGTSSAASPEVTVATGPAALDATDNITVAVPAVTGMAYMEIYRTTGGAAPPKLIYSGTAPSYVDTGTEIGAETPATKNTTGYAVAARAKITGLSSHANNAAALAAGLVAGDLYTITGSDPLALAVAY